MDDLKEATAQPGSQPQDGAGPAPDPLAPDEEAPYGYMIDPKTKERRPKKLPGRPVGRGTPPATPPPGVSPPLDDLKADKKAKKTPDRAPGKTRGKAGRFTKRDKPAEEPLPPFREGPIAKGVNKLYAKAGKIVRVMDSDIGTAILAATRKESEDDVTVGEAWEEVARTNPRIRRFLLKVIEGGAWGQLVWAHAPILLAIVMKESIAKHIPFMKLVEALLADTDTGEPTDLSAAVGGLTPEDAQQMMDAALAQMGPMMASMMGMGRAPNGGAPRQPVVVVQEPDGEPDTSGFFGQEPGE